MSFIQYVATHRVNLLGGVSDAGKSRFVIPVMASSGKQWAYVSGDRSIEDAKETIFKLGFTIGHNLGEIPLLTAFGRHHRSLAMVMQALAEWSPQPEYVIYEGFQRQCQYPNRPDCVYQFLGEVDAYLLPSKQFPKGIHLVGIAESPKQKPRERYADPRHRISGCTAWVSHASTVFVQEPMDDDPACKGPNRHLWICPKNGPRVEFNGVFDPQGRVIFPTL